MKKLLVLVLLFIASPAWAQNPTCPTRPAGDSSNACASTAFVTNDAITIVANNTALKASKSTTTVYRAGFTTAGDGGGMTYNYSATPCSNADNGAFVQSTALSGCWIAAINGAPVSVLVWGATCGGADSTIAVLAAIGGLFAQPRPGGALVVPCRVGMDGALAVPYTGTAPPIQPPLRITGLVPPSLDGSLLGRTPPGGGTLDLRYTGVDGLHPAKIDTRGMGVLEIDHLKIEDTGGSNFLFLQTTNTTVRLHDNHWAGNTACVAPACSQDILQFGGITNASSTLGTDAATAGFQGYNSSVTNEVFSYCRHAMNFGGSANGIIITNAMTDYTCGSAEATGAPFVFYGTGLQTEGNIIFGGAVEMTHYAYAVAFNDTDATCATGSSYKNSVIGLTASDSSGGTLGYAYFKTTCEKSNLIQPGYSDTANFLVGPGAAGNLLIVPGVLYGLPYFSDGSGIAKFFGTSTVLGFGTEGVQTGRLIGYGVTDGASGVAFIGPTGDTTNGIVGNLFEVGYVGHFAAMTIDLSGNVGIQGRSIATLTQSKAQAFASLPACSGALEGTTASVTNSTTATWGDTITGGGANHVGAYCNGTNWTVAAK